MSNDGLNEACDSDGSDLRYHSADDGDRGAV